MRLSRPRFTVRRLMIAVAIVAACLCGESIRRRRAACLERLAWLDKQEMILATSDPAEEREIASRYLKQGKQMGAAEALEEIAIQKYKYEFAASHFWLPMPVDSPEPEGRRP